MHIQYIRGFLIIGLALCAQDASAFISAPYIAPANPVDGDTISVNVYRDECDVLDIGIVPPAIERHGSHIKALFTGIHEGDPEWCIYGTGTETVSIGSFPSGSYTLDVERRYMWIGGEWIQETLGIVPFAVSGGRLQPPLEAPTLSVTGFATLCLFLLAAALLRMRREI